MSTSLGVDVLGADGTVVASAAHPDHAVALLVAYYARTGLPCQINTVGWIAALGPVVDPQQAPPPEFGLQAQIGSDPSMYDFNVVNAAVDIEVNFGDGDSVTILADGPTDFAHAYADAGTYHVTASSGTHFAEVYVNPGNAPVEPATVDG